MVCSCVQLHVSEQLWEELMKKLVCLKSPGSKVSTYQEELYYSAAQSFLEYSQTTPGAAAFENSL